MKHLGILVLALVTVVAVAGILIVSETPTGESAKWLAPKSRSCHYLDQDNFGECLHIEKQMGECDPPETAASYRGYEYGWFLRLCQPLDHPSKF